MIGIVLTLFSGCVVPGDVLQGDTLVSMHGAHDAEELTLDGSLKAIMRARSQATTGETGGAAWLLEDDGEGGATERCATDDEGHPVCCEVASTATCCVHHGADGELRVCL